MPAYPPWRTLLIAILSTLLPAGASAERSNSIQQAPITITTSTPSAATWTAETLLRNLLGLIKTSSSARGISAHDLSVAMKQPAIELGSDRFGYSGHLSPDWGFALMLRHPGDAAARVDLEFLDATEQNNAPATDICNIDFDEVATELEGAGFKRDMVHGEHGRTIYDLFHRTGLSIKIESFGEASAPPDKILRSCIRSLSIQ